MRGSDGGGDAPPFAGLRVLVAEDDFLIALDVADMLRGLGCVVLGPAATVAEALALAGRGRPDAALLDLALQDGGAIPVAAVLRAAGVPFAVTTGFPDDYLVGAAAALREVPWLAKPYAPDEFRRVLAGLLRRA